MKPLGQKAYGSIPHLIGSRLGSGDHHVEPGQARIATEKARDKYDTVFVTEKLDGGNVAVAKVNGEILALTRSGYLATTSPYLTHLVFDRWVKNNMDRFMCLLKEGERICGEWMFTAVGTKYNLPHEPFVPFDLMTGTNRVCYDNFLSRVEACNFQTPRLIHIGPISIDKIEPLLDPWAFGCGVHGAMEPVEGAVWRVERKGVVDFLCKYVRPSKVDGKYLNTHVVNGFPDGGDLVSYFNSLLCEDSDNHS